MLTGGKWLSIDSKRLQGATRAVDHLPLTWRYVVRIVDDKEHLNNEGKRTMQSLQSLSRITGSWKVCFLECLQGVILRNEMRHLEAARWHTAN